MSNYVYLAGPITGLTFSQATDWRIETMNKMPHWIHTLSPLRAKEYLKSECLKVEPLIKKQYEDSTMSSAKGINTRDYNDVKRSAAILVNFLDTNKVSIGTVMEIAWAKVFEIPIVLIINKGNIHEHPMIETSCGFIVNSLNEGIDTIINIIGSDKQIKLYKQLKDLKNDIVEKKDKNSEQIKTYMEACKRYNERTKSSIPFDNDKYNQFKSPKQTPVQYKLGIENGYEIYPNDYSKSCLNNLTAQMKQDHKVSVVITPIDSIEQKINSNYIIDSDPISTSSINDPVIAKTFTDEAGKKGAEYPSNKSDHMTSWKEFLELVGDNPVLGGAFLININDIK